ncbi:MAG: copper ion binding protein, partial [Promethearchaeota archaeon]
MENQKTQVIKSKLNIQGMHCASCAQTISKNLSKVDGVDNINVNIATNKAYFTYDPRKITKNEIIKNIENTGYGATPSTEKEIIKVGGMTCASCAQTIEKALSKSPGIINANVNISTEKATVIYDTEVLNYEDIAKIIDGTGYKALGKAETSAGRKSYNKELE